MSETDRPPPTVLYRFGQRRYLDPFLRCGAISFARASFYQRNELTNGQRDNEQQRTFKLDPSTHEIVITKGDKSTPVTDLTKLELSFDLYGLDGKPLNYYIWCASHEYDEHLYTEFGADSCVRIHDPALFGKRLLEEARRKFPSVTPGIPGCDLYGRTVQYQDHNTFPTTTDQIDLIFLKNQQYAHQNEFRIFFATDPGAMLPDRIEFELGSLEDVADFYTT